MNIRHCRFVAPNRTQIVVDYSLPTTQNTETEHSHQITQTIVLKPAEPMKTDTIEIKNKKARTPPVVNSNKQSFSPKRIGAQKTDSILSQSRSEKSKKNDKEML